TSSRHTYFHVLTTLPHSTPSSFSFQPPPHPRHLHSFPTRRSSDLDPGRIPGYQAGFGAGTSENKGYTVRLGETHVFSDNVVNERSEEHTSELQSQSNLVCRLLLEKKKKKKVTETNM